MQAPSPVALVAAVAVERLSVFAAAPLMLAFALLSMGCGGPEKREATSSPPAPSSSVSSNASNASNASASKPDSTPVSASSATASSSPFHKRTRTAPAKPPGHDGTKPKNGRPLNPKDSVGRTVFVRADDQCFIEVPPKEKPAPDAEPTRATEMVDCPPAADDPAWDHCSAQIVLDLDEKRTERCFCVTGAGNPRPMPNPTPCPAVAKNK